MVSKSEVSGHASRDARYNCCIDVTMSVIEGRWKCTILCMLFRNGPMRYSELQRKISDISSRILSKQLKELERDGMIDRVVTSDRKLCVTYELTGKGRTIIPLMTSMAEWGARYQMMRVVLPDGLAENTVSERSTMSETA